MSTKLKAGTATNGAVIDADTAGTLEIQTGSTPTTAISIDASQVVTMANGTNLATSSGNVGIGTSSPAAKLVIEGGTSTDQFRMGTGANYYQIGRNTTDGLLYLYGSQAAAYGYVFSGAGGERMRIDASGNLLVGLAAQVGTQNTPLNLKKGSGVAWQVGPTAVNSAFVVMNSADIGVYVPSGNTSWTGTSDERLKTDLKPIENAVNKVSTLRAVTGRFKTDDEGTSRSFLIAQDVQKVLPEAVSKQDDEIGTLGVAYTDVIPLLVAAIKELKAEVDALKGAK